MAVSPAKENILKRIRQALSHPAPLPFAQSEGANSVYQPPGDDLEILFAQEFSKLQGKFAFCFDEANMKKQVNALLLDKGWTKIYCSEPKWNSDFSNTINLAGCDAAITGCESLVARTGSIVLSAAEQSGRT